MEVDAVSRLDGYLNRRLVSAMTDAERHRWWAVKVRSKRLLARLDDPKAIADLARRIWTVLQQPAPKPAVARARRKKTSIAA